MVWGKVERDNAPLLDEYLSVLLTESAYDGSDISGLHRLIDRGCELWFYKSGQNRIALCVDPDIDGRMGRAKVVNAVPHGPASGVVFCREIISKIREIVDRNGKEEFFAKAHPSYSSQKMIEFVSAIEDVIWEAPESPEVDPRSGKKHYRFDRSASRRQRNRDDLFEGPREKRRKARKRRGGR